MTDKKFIDGEIIKANDILNKLDFFNQRAGRELWNEKPVEIQYTDIRSREEDIKFLKEIINRQEAEIERLENENEILIKNADTAFQDGLNEAQDLYAEQVKAEIKSEAIKEFAERLKKRFYLCAGRCVVNVYHIDNLVKEMVGEE